MTLKLYAFLLITCNIFYAELAMCALAAATTGTTWDCSTSAGIAEYCTWNGVTCNENGDVTSLVLNGISGKKI